MGACNVDPLPAGELHNHLPVVAVEPLPNRRCRFDVPPVVRLQGPALDGCSGRAIRIRDASCIFPSCSRPAQWCDIYHIDEFASGGHTNVARMVCLCRRHDTLIHNSPWIIDVNPDGTFNVTHPARAP